MSPIQEEDLQQERQLLAHVVLPELPTPACTHAVRMHTYTHTKGAHTALKCKSMTP